MPIRQPVLDRSTVKALLVLTKTRCKASDHALRPPVSPNTVYRLNQMLPSAETLKLILPPGLRYVVVGGVASAHYQPARFTEDVDLMVLAEDATAFEQALFKGGWSQINLLYAPDQSWVSVALDTSIETLEGLQIIDLPYLLILKLSATRAVDISDIVGMLQQASDTEKQRIRRIIETYRSDLLEDFDQFGAIAQLS